MDIQGENTWMVLIIRILVVFVSMLMTYWSAKALRSRRKLHISEFADYVLVVVGSYWVGYTLYVLYLYIGQDIPALAFYLFNMRFGLLLTLVVLTTLMKDRILLTDLFEKVNELNGGGDNGTREP